MKGLAKRVAAQIAETDRARLCPRPKALEWKDYPGTAGAIAVTALGRYVIQPEVDGWSVILLDAAARMNDGLPDECADRRAAQAAAQEHFDSFVRSCLTEENS